PCVSARLPISAVSLAYSVHSYATAAPRCSVHVRDELNQSRSRRKNPGRVLRTSKECQGTEASCCEIQCISSHASAKDLQQKPHSRFSSDPLGARHTPLCPDIVGRTE